MSTPKIEKDEQGRWKVTGVQNRVIDTQAMDFQQLRSAAKMLPGDTGVRVRSVLDQNPLASGGILSGLVENGAMPDNELARALIDIDQQTKAKRQLDAFKERQKAETEKFNNTFRGRLWNGVKAASRAVLLPGQTVLEAINSGVRDVANVGESFWKDTQGVFKGDLDWWTLDSKVPGKTRQQLGYGEKINLEDYIGPTALEEKMKQITAYQIAEELVRDQKVDVGQGFFVSEEFGAGFRARQAQIKSRGIEVQMGDRTYIRPYSAIDPITNLITGGRADTQLGTLVTALGEVFLAWKVDPFIRASKKARELEDLRRQAVTSEGAVEAKKLTQIANAEAELEAANKKTRELFEAYKISPASTADEARKAFDNALTEEMAVAQRVDDMVDTGYDAGAIASFLSSTKGEAIIDWLADANWRQIWSLGKAGPNKTGFTFRQAVALGKATTRDEVLRTIAPYIANGSVIANVLESGTKTGQFLSKVAAGTDTLVPNVLKTNAARVIKQLPFISKVANATNGRIDNKVVRFVDAVRRNYNTVIPAQSMVHFADTDLLASHIRDYGRIANVSDNVLDGILDGLAVSEDIQTGSYNAVKALMDAIVSANAGRKGVDKAELKRITRVFESAKEEMSTYWANRHAAGAQLDYVFADGRVVSLSGPHLESELLNSMFYFPDARELLRTISAANKVKGLGLTREGADFLVGNVWKKFILVRPAYIIRNIMEEQIRVFGGGHVSFFNNPLTAMAMWVGRDGSSKNWRRLLAKFDPYRNTVTDNSFKLGSAADEFGAEVAAHGTIDEYLTFIQDNVNAAMERDSVIIKNILNYGNVQQGHSRFWEGVANEIRMLRNTVAARAAIINEANPQKAVDYLLRGEGKEEWLKFANSQKKTTRDFLLSDEGLMMYLYTGTDGGRLTSLMSRIEEVAGNGGPASIGIKRLIANGEFKTSVGSLKAPTAVESAANSIKNAREVAKGRKSLADVNKEFADELARYFDGQGDWKGVNFKLPISREVAEFGAVRSKIDGFFDIAVKFEKQTTMGPEWRQKYWDTIYDIAKGLDSDAVESLARVADKSLSPLVSWTGKPIGREHKVWSAFKSATGKGNITKDEAHAYASRVASQHVANLFYDASRKRLLYHQLRLIVPFGQAWDDTIQAWSKISLNNPDQVYKVAKSLEWLTSPESASLYQLTDARDIYDPNQGFFFTDQRSGERKLFIPFLGTGLSFLANLFSGQGLSTAGPVALSATPQSFNFAFASGSIIPGIGPGVTFPVALLDQLGLNPIPNGFLRETAEKIMFPFGKPNVQEGVIETFLLSGNWRRVLSGPFVEASYASAFSPIMSYLLSSGDYDLDDTESQAKLIKDTTYFARWFTFFRGIFGFVSAAPPQLETLAKDQTGNTILATALYNDFKKLEVESGGDYNKAYGDFIDLYGPQALFSMISTTSGGPTNHLTYEMLKKDPTVLDKYSDVYGYFYPGGGFSQELYNLQRRQNRREKLNAQEIVSRVTTIRYYAAKDRLLTRAMSEGWDGERLDAANEALKEAYVMRGLKLEGDFYKNARVMQQLKEAVNDERFVDSDAVEGLKRYLFFREEALKKAGKDPNGTLRSKGTIAQRTWLANKASEIIRDNPEFYKMFYSFFRKELDVE